MVQIISAIFVIIISTIVTTHTKVYIGECSYDFCEQICVQISFGYMKCKCRQGFVLKPDGRSCDEERIGVYDTDEIESSSGNSEYWTTNCDNEDGNCEDIVVKETSNKNKEEGSGGSGDDEVITELETHEIDDRQSSVSTNPFTPTNAPTTIKDDTNQIVTNLSSVDLLTQVKSYQTKYSTSSFEHIKTTATPEFEFYRPTSKNSKLKMSATTFHNALEPTPATSQSSVISKHGVDLKKVSKQPNSINSASRQSVSGNENSKSATKMTSSISIATNQVKDVKNYTESAYDVTEKISLSPLGETINLKTIMAEKSKHFDYGDTMNTSYIKSSSVGLSILQTSDQPSTLTNSSLSAHGLETKLLLVESSRALSDTMNSHQFKDFITAKAEFSTTKVQEFASSIFSLKNSFKSSIKPSITKFYPEMLSTNIYEKRKDNITFHMNNSITHPKPLLLKSSQAKLSNYLPQSTMHTRNVNISKSKKINSQSFSLKIIAIKTSLSDDTSNKTSRSPTKDLTNSNTPFLNTISNQILNTEAIVNTQASTKTPDTENIIDMNSTLDITNTKSTRNINIHTKSTQAKHIRNITQPKSILNITQTKSTKYIAEYSNNTNTKSTKYTAEHSNNSNTKSTKYIAEYSNNTNSKSTHYITYTSSTRGNSYTNNTFVYTHTKSTQIKFNRISVTPSKALVTPSVITETGDSNSNGSVISPLFYLYFVITCFIMF